jgi:hypothetical protein
LTKNSSKFNRWFQYSSLEYCLITLRICGMLFKCLLTSYAICRLHNLWSPFKIPFYSVPPIVFSFRAHVFFYLGTIRRLSWYGSKMSHWRFRDNRRMNTSVQNFTITMIKCCILLKPVLVGADGNLHFPFPPMNRLNQTESATFTILSFC